MDLPKLQLKLRLVKTVGREEQRTTSISNMNENTHYCGNLTLLIPFQYSVLLFQLAQVIFLITHGLYGNTLSSDEALYALSFLTLSILGCDAQTQLVLSVKQHRGGNESIKRKLEEKNCTILVSYSQKALTFNCQRQPYQEIRKKNLFIQESTNTECLIHAWYCSRCQTYSSE